MCSSRIVLILLGIIWSWGAQAQTTLDPCFYQKKSSVSIAITATGSTTTQLVALGANQIIYICGYSFSMADASSTAASSFQLETGGSTTCTSPTALTGTYTSNDFAGVSPVPIVVNVGTGHSTITAGISGDAVCALTTGGTNPFIQGVLTYVQQ